MWFIVEVDFVTPLCSQVTYEGLLDDMFGISCACVEFGKEITQKDQPVKVMVNSQDQVKQWTSFIYTTHPLNTDGLDL